MFAPALNPGTAVTQMPLSCPAPKLFAASFLQQLYHSTIVRAFAGCQFIFGGLHVPPPRPPLLRLLRLLQGATEGLQYQLVSLHHNCARLAPPGTPWRPAR
jgi:hypothetical protein